MNFKAIDNKRQLDGPDRTSGAASACSLLLRSARPAHWLKNVLVFTAVFFSGRMGDSLALLQSIVGFVAFCAAASAMYVANDLADAAVDAADPLRSRRPVASGALPGKTAVAAVVALVFAAVAAGAFLGPVFVAVIVAYIAAMTAYSFCLKKWNSAGIPLIAAGMVLRVVAGAEAIGVPISPWVWPSTFLLTLFVVAGKRIYDARNGVSIGLVAMFRTFGALTFVVYAVYLLAGPATAKFHHPAVLYLTIAPVGAALWRYGIVVRAERDGREHFLHVVSDPFIIASMICWSCLFAVSIYVR